jgi:hypothetical protein
MREAFCSCQKKQLLASFFYLATAPLGVGVYKYNFECPVSSVLFKFLINVKDGGYHVRL